MEQTARREFPPVTKARIKNHFHYDWWRYLALVAGAILLWNLLYNMTHYRSPENLKVELVYETANMQSTDALMNMAHEEALSDMEEVTFIAGGYDETYGQMQLTVWAAAGTGDLYALPKERFKNFAESETFVDLQPYVDSGELQLGDLDRSSGYVRLSETGERILAGIPMDGLTWLNAYELPVEGYYMSVLAKSGNEENTVRLMNWLLQKQAKIDQAEE